MSHHQIIAERVEVLEKIQKILGKKAKINFFIHYAKKKLPCLAYIINPKIKDTIMITAGCHGNEPAPVYALLNLLKRKKMERKRIVIIPCIVPYGFCVDSDKNKNGVDINRNFFSKRSEKETRMIKRLVRKYKPRFVVNMHEDPDEKMFYIYLEGKEYRKKANKIISVVGKIIPCYKRKKIHNDQVINGIIEAGEVNGSFEDYLTTLEIPNICTETPGLIPFKKRIKINEKILNVILKDI